MNYKKVYYRAFNYPLHKDTFVASELSGNRAVDIHHICTREHIIENLMGLTRQEHVLFGDIKSQMVFLLKRHREFLIEAGVDFNESWFNSKIMIYEHLG